MSKKKNIYNAEFKSRVVLELLSGQHTLNELAEKYQIAPATLSSWNKQFQERAADIFQRGHSDEERTLAEKEQEIYIKEYTTPREMIAGVNNYMLDYNAVRPHASLGGLTPNTFYQQQTTNQAA